MVGVSRRWGHNQEGVITHENTGSPWTRGWVEPHRKTYSRSADHFSGWGFTVP